MTNVMAVILGVELDLLILIPIIALLEFTYKDTGRRSDLGVGRGIV